MSVLIIEDNLSLSKLISMLLTSEEIDNETADNGFEGLAKLSAKEYDVVLTDLRMPKISGFEVCEKAKTLYPNMPVVIMTAFGNIPDAVAAIRGGAYDYITKPFENDDLLNTLKKAIELSRMRRENASLKEYMKQSNSPVMVGKSPTYLSVIKLAETVAPTDAPVLILGESGTGKELTAKKIHSMSRRAEKQFIAVNCAAIPENLFESELFGHKKGSFTSADKDYKGKIAEADGGTLFLDEIGELPIGAQVKLLRFLQESEIQPVGATSPVKVNARIIAATNKDLKKLSSTGEFREDLFYRLNVFPLELPTLSQRQEDIDDLVALFSRKYGSKVTFSKEALDVLRTQQWKGNIRELENVIYRICILKGSGDVTPDDLPIEMRETVTSCLEMSLPDDGLDLEELEKNIIKKALNKFGGNKSKAAQYLNMPRHVLLYRLEKFDLK